MSSGPIISTIGSGTLSLQGTKSSAAKVDSQKDQTSETKDTASPPSLADTVSTQTIDGRTNTLSNILDGISQSIQTIEVTQESAEKIFSLLKQGLNLAHQASQNIIPPNVDELSSLKVKFNNILRQLSQAADDASHRGTNILKGNNLLTSFGENARNNITTRGIDASANGLGIADANFSSKASIDATTEQVSKAIRAFEVFSKDLHEDSELIKTRQNFTKETIGSIDEATPVSTDEGANLLALQIGQQLAQLGDNSLASTDQKDLLRLF